MALSFNWLRIKKNCNILPYITILGAILFLLKTTWMQWGDVIIDLGREMYIPLEILRGKVLYTDIHYIYGPFPVYLHALLYKIFGPHINVLIICGIVITSLTTILLYKIARLFMNTICSSFVSLTFLFICAFGNYVYLNNYNFILPYTYASTYGILFSLLTVYFFFKFIYNKKIRNLILCSIFTTLALLCKIEIGISLLISITVTMFFYNRRFNHILISLSPVVFIIIYILGRKNFLDAVSIDNKQFLNWIAGITDFNENIYLLTRSLFAYIFVILCLLSFDYILSTLKDNVIVKTFITFILYLLTFIIIIFINNFINPYTQYRILPIICLITILFSIKKRNINTFTISLFSFLLISRIILKTSSAHYGFYILVPGLITYYLFFYNIIPAVWQRFTKNGLYYLSISIFFILLIVNHFYIYRPIYKNRTLRIETKRGSINYLNNIIGIRYKELIDFLINNTHPGETLVVFPEGVDINFYTGLDNPIFHNTFLPFELAQDTIQDEIISLIDHARVDYIVIIQRDTTEYGPSSFGIDYGKELFSWIKENYEIVKTLGPTPFTTGEFGIAVMKKN